MDIGTLYREVRDRFRRHLIESAELDARILVAAALKLNLSEVILKSDEHVDDQSCEAARTYATDRISGKSVGRILERREFWGLNFALNDDTLEPRPDTEVLVDAVLGRSLPAERLSFADIGTGTGAIAIALLTERKNAWAVATDISVGALRCAKHNAERLGVADRVLFCRANYVSALGADLDWVISNPPYIRSNVIEELSPEVRVHDPERALDGGSDGLDAYRAIIDRAEEVLGTNGRIALEIGFDQAAAVSAMLRRANFVDIEIIQDLAGHDRVLVAKRNEIDQF